MEQQPDYAQLSALMQALAEQANANIGAQLDQLRTEMETMHAATLAAIGTVQTDIGNIQATIGNIQATIGNIQADIGTMQTDIGNIQATLGPGPGNIHARLQNLEGTFPAAIADCEVRTGLRQLNHSARMPASTIFPLPLPAGVQNPPNLPTTLHEFESLTGAQLAA